MAESVLTDEAGIQAKRRIRTLYLYNGYIKNNNNKNKEINIRKTHHILQGSILLTTSKNQVL